MVCYISRQVVKKLDAEKQMTFHLGRLPEPITNLRACQKCPQLINCAIYQRCETEQGFIDVLGEEDVNFDMHCKPLKTLDTWAQLFKTNNFVS